MELSHSLPPFLHRPRTSSPKSHAEPLAVRKSLCSGALIAPRESNNVGTKATGLSEVGPTPGSWRCWDELRLQLECHRSFAYCHEALACSCSASIFSGNSDSGEDPRASPEGGGPDWEAMDRPRFNHPLPAEIIPPFSCSALLGVGAEGWIPNAFCFDRRLAPPSAGPTACFFGRPRLALGSCSANDLISASVRPKPLAGSPRPGLPSFRT